MSTRRTIEALARGCGWVVIVLAAACCALCIRLGLESVETTGQAITLAIAVAWLVFLVFGPPYVAITVLYRWSRREPLIPPQNPSREGRMFRKVTLDKLAYWIGATLLAAGILWALGGIVLAIDETEEIFEAASLFLGWMWVGLVTVGVLYLVVGVLYRLNQSVPHNVGARADEAAQIEAGQELPARVSAAP